MNKRINFFDPGSGLFPFRWFIVIAVFLAGVMLYADLNGMSLFSFSDQQQWNASGPGYHK